MTSDPNFFGTKVPGFFARIRSSLSATENVYFSRYFFVLFGGRYSFTLLFFLGRWVIRLVFNFTTQQRKKTASLMFRPFTVCQVVASDSGRIVILEYDGTKNMSNSQQWMDGVSVDGWFW